MFLSFLFSILTLNITVNSDWFFLTWPTVTVDMTRLEAEVEKLNTAHLASSLIKQNYNS